MAEITRRIVPITNSMQTYQVNGVTYRIRSRFEKFSVTESNTDIRDRMKRCLIADKNILTQIRENDIIQAGTVYSAAQKEEIA